MKVCDQEDCPIYPYEKEIEKVEVEEKIEEESIPISLSTITDPYVANGSITWNTISASNWTITPVLSEESIRNISMKIKIDELDVCVDMKCLMCKHFNRVDMKTELKVYEARKALES